MEIVDDFKPDDDIAKKHHLPSDRHCRPKSFALTSDLSTPTRINLCPMFFTRGTIDAGLRKVPPGYQPVTGGTIEPVTCDTIGARVSPAMATKGHTVLHEYTHITEVMQSIFGGVISTKGRTDDHAYGFDRCRKLDKTYARVNADSYASFATELFWTTMCKRDFDPPSPVGPQSSPDELNDLLIGLDLGRTTKGESSVKGGSAAKGGSAVKGGSAAKRNLVAKGASSAKGTGTPATKATSTTTGTPSKKGPSTATGTQQQKSQREDQSALSLQKRTAFSQPYEHPIPRTDFHSNYPVELMDLYLEAHRDALHICSVIIEEAERNTDRFNRIFGLYFKPEDRDLILSMFLLR
jgi:hypothetical protein